MTEKRQHRDTSIMEQDSEVKLSAAQKARIERNKQKALLLRQARLTSHPYTKDKKESGQKLKAPVKEVDTEAGFFFDEDDEVQETNSVKVKHPEGPVMATDNLFCEDCEREFMDSYLNTHFDVHDCDFDKREPALKFVVRKNPHNSSWGDMKLYYEKQVLERAVEVHGSEEKIEEAANKREENREKTKQKRFDKKVKELRRAVRGSLFKKDLGPHEHEFGSGVYDEEEDVYRKTCITCGHVVTYEEM
ncbi:hypothetical protein KUTeg_017436 [Tegillarca granosa]|uniref:XPA C-terminal domain-containing protein n=1 Tax=Tegillarca granosa TaxID=220873 RepID=A0ABQ9EKT2_TEGGR|nr:hypothetical protein KUTeg_017436 [Tegillarca granosa]